NLFFAFLFGLIHGLGFSNYFKMMIGKEENKLQPLIEFALGIEAAQIIIVLGILIIGTFLQGLFKVSRRDWIMVTSSIVIGFAIQMMLARVFW
ncbi:MAG: HupE/UreJ family protein, partial [Polaribacter sp.]